MLYLLVYLHGGHVFMPSGYCIFHIYPYMLSDSKCFANIKNDESWFLTLRSVNRTPLVLGHTTITTKRDVLRTLDLFLPSENNHP